MAFHLPPNDLESSQPFLRIQPEPETHKPFKGVVVLSVCSLLILSLVGIIFNGQPARLPAPFSSENPTTTSSETVTPAIISRGKKEGVSEKVFSSDGVSYPWTNTMLRWQRSGYHFQPQKNWMNGPLYYNGYYHLFYQYNPDSAVWGNITWGHAISTDMIHWKYLPLSMVPDQWYDINGVWSGSATIMPDGNIMMLYTGDTDKFVQVQNLAYPANLSDPLLLDWVKYSGNPVLTPPPGIGPKDFRDPTTAWLGPNGVWMFVIGTQKDKTGISLVYTTKDFKTYELESNLHGVPGTGMWECVDFYPVSTTGQNGLDTSAYGPGMKHVLKASLDDNKQDHYALGTYDMKTQTWTPDNPDMDVGIGLRLDYGKYYASKTFFDQNKQRRILWGWWPVKELESLRRDITEYDNVVLKPGSISDLNITSASQMDVSAEFVVDPEAIKTAVGDDVINNCSAAAVRQALGPFGLLVLADGSLSEFTPVYFYIAKASDGTVDHSIVEAFGQGGRTCITSRIYPTKASNGDARLYLFNNATDSSVTASVKIWKLGSAEITSYKF
ncbi:Acid beta-fructofuranosidase AIV-18 [Bienertia sinuspersici]